MARAHKELIQAVSRTSTTRFAVEELFFLQVALCKKAKDFFATELHTRAVQVREAKEAVESTRAGLSRQEGDVRKTRKEKKKTKEGEKVAPAKARFRVPYTKNSFFWFTSIWA
jgi:hypothetical protein